LFAGAKVVNGSNGQKMPWLRPFLSYTVSFKVNKIISINQMVQTLRKLAFW
jgi:hypothetical protein